MSTALKDDLLHTAIPPGRLWSPPAPPALAPGIVHSRFSVQGDARQSFLAWQERMSPVYDIQPPSKRADDTFDASLSRYTIDNLSLFDFRTAPNLAVRSLGRVSTESIRDLTFSVYLDGQPGQFLGGKPQPDAPHTPHVPGILALDMDQPCTVRSFHSRILLLFVPRALVEKSFPDAASLHGRWVHATTPLTRLLIEHRRAGQNGSASVLSHHGRAARRCVQPSSGSFRQRSRGGTGSRLWTGAPVCRGSFARSGSVA
jgi:hypothetical protein